MISTEPLFTATTIGRLCLPNRFVMAPMSRHFSVDGLSLIHI